MTMNGRPPVPTTRAVQLEDRREARKARVSGVGRPKGAGSPNCGGAGTSGGKPDLV